MATTPTYPAAAGPTPILKTFTGGGTPDGGVIVDILDNSAGTRALKVDALVVVTDNSANRVVTLYKYSGSVSYPIGAVAVPALSGSDGSTARVNMLTTLGITGADGIPVIWVNAGVKLQAKVNATLDTGKVLTISGNAVSYADS